MCFFINRSLLAVHVACGDDPDQRTVLTQGEGDMQLSIVVGVTQYMKTLLCARMLSIGGDQQRFIHEDLFRFGLRDAVLGSAFSYIAGVPLKAG